MVGVSLTIAFLRSIGEKDWFVFTLMLSVDLAIMCKTKSRPRSVMERGPNLKLSYKCYKNQYNTNCHIQSAQNSKRIFNLFAFQ